MREYHGCTPGSSSSTSSGLRRVSLLRVALDLALGFLGAFSTTVSSASAFLIAFSTFTACIGAVNLFSITAYMDARTCYQPLDQSGIDHEHCTLLGRPVTHAASDAYSLGLSRQQLAPALTQAAGMQYHSNQRNPRPTSACIADLNFGVFGLQLLLSFSFYQLVHIAAQSSRLSRIAYGHLTAIP